MSTPAPRPTEATSAAVEARPAAAPPRVLFVDDDDDVRAVVTTMLEAADLQVTPAGSAEEALSRLASAPFDLVILDWNLPKMNGLELCRTLRQCPKVGRTPVLFLTANACSKDMVEAFACGADDYLVKPFRAPELSARIFSLLRRAISP